MKRSSAKTWSIFQPQNRELTAADHPLIRDEEACFESSLTAIQFAKKYDSRLHIFHLSTEKEMQLFTQPATPGRKTDHGGSMCTSPAFYQR